MPCVWTHACRSLDAALHAAKAVLLRAVLAVAFVLVASQIAHATCTVTSPTLTLTSSAYTYPFAGGGTGVSVTFTASYNVTSSGGAGGQCGNQTIDIIPALTGGAFSGASCASLSMPISPNTTAVHTVTCTQTWTEPASPGASYNVTATANAAGTAFDIGRRIR